MPRFFKWKLDGSDSTVSIISTWAHRSPAPPTDRWKSVPPGQTFGIADGGHSFEVIHWRADYKKVFALANEELYKALISKVRTAKAVNALGADTEYWTQASNIVLRAKDEAFRPRARTNL